MSLNKTEKLTSELTSFLNLCDKAKEIVFATYCKCKLDGKQFLKTEFVLSQELIPLSPIEQILAVAMMFCEKVSTSKPKIKLNIKYQEPVKVENTEYIADFIIHSVKVDNKTKTLNKPIIIECDGFEYHSKKEQMSHDYKRERTLKLNGFDMLRFTGSQIYNEPIVCAREVLKYVSNILGG